MTIVFTTMGKIIEEIGNIMNQQVWNFYSRTISKWHNDHHLPHFQDKFIQLIIIPSQFLLAKYAKEAKLNGSMNLKNHLRQQLKKSISGRTRMQK